METAPGLTSNMEDYLEAVYQIIREKKVARVKDIAAHMGVGKSSVTGALRQLAAESMVHYAPYELITLTPKGESAARDIFGRHNTLCDFFIEILGIDCKEAEDCACRMEHALSPTIQDRLDQLVTYMKTEGPDRSNWLK